MTNTTIEVLAPAGSEQAVIAAVRSGADAVYLGGSLFNARRNAENFDKDTLKKTVDYCHRFGVLVYFTLNISVHENELESALEEAKNANECGVDAFIVSDLGLAKILKKSIKGVVLHGSTQLSVSLLKELGFSRIVVAREMSLDDLERFCKAADKFGIEVEAFVHGALCMCLSGQCYLSAFLGSRSGNRGLCAGPCRLPFSAPDTKSGYDLSLKDLSLLEYVDTLKRIGVKSFKIEGRMKRPEYVGAVTDAFRQAVDFGFVSDNTKRLLKDVFSRSGFTDGYFTDKVDKNMFGIRTSEDAKISSSVLNELHALYRSERQRVPLKAKMVLKSGVAATLCLSDGEHDVTLCGDIPEIAQTHAADCEYLKKQISKLGSTPFYLSEFECEIDENITLAGSKINDLRRRCVLELEQKRFFKKPKEFVKDICFQRHEYKNPLNLSGLYARFDNLEAIPKNINSLSGIILPLDCDFERASNIHKNIFLQIPRAFTDGELIRKKLSLAAPFIKGAFCDTLAAIGLCREYNIAPVGSFGLNVYNSHTLNVLEDFGLNGITVSFETHIKNSLALESSIPKGVIIYGHLPLMIFKNCPIKQNVGCAKCKRSGALIDRKGISFPLLCRFGYTELYNSLPLYLADINEFDAFGFKILYFTSEDKNTAEKIIDGYALKLPADFEYTRGLYKKGVE